MLGKKIVDWRYLSCIDCLSFKYLLNLEVIPSLMVHHMGDKAPSYTHTLLGRS